MGTIKPDSRRRNALAEISIVTGFTLGVLLMQACASYSREERNPLGLSKEQVETVCLAYTACSGPEGFGDDPGRCSLLASGTVNATRWELGRLVLQRPILVAMLMNADCIAQAMGSCEAMGACAAASDSGWKPELNRCEDDHVMLIGYMGNPNDDRVIRLDCSELGLRCVDPPSSQLLCAMPGSDDLEEEVVTCKGSVATVHARGYQFKVDCSLSGADCVPGPYSISSYPCIGTGDECDDQFQSTCDGTKLTHCRNGRKATYDCADHWLGCGIREDGNAACSPPGCYPELGEASCNDNAITYCGFDGLTTVDCAEIGFESCFRDMWNGVCTGGWATD